MQSGTFFAKYYQLTCLFYNVAIFGLGLMNSTYTNKINTASAMLIMVDLFSFRLKTMWANQNIIKPLLHQHTFAGITRIKKFDELEYWVQVA